MVSAEMTKLCMVYLNIQIAAGDRYVQRDIALKRANTENFGASVNVLAVSPIKQRQR